MTEAKEYIFYTFICNDPNITDSYVGSTYAFRQRKSHHKGDCNNETSKKYNYKIYQNIRANGGWDNWEMKPIDKRFCSRLEARIHETKLMEERNATLNMQRPFRSIEVSKQDKAIRDKKYWEKNSNEINARRRELRALKKAEENK